MNLLKAGRIKQPPSINDSEQQANDTVNIVDSQSR